MSDSLMDDAFAHHAWATLQLLDACIALDEEQLEMAVPGTYGSILETQRHLVGSDAWYLFVATGDRAHLTDEDTMSLPQLRTVMEANGPAWLRLLASGVDADSVLDEVDDDDGYERHIPMGIQLAQVLHHGTDHRSQICTALTTLGVEPPSIDVWDYGNQSGRVVEVAPPS
jgi:uncharacterized damage-inducible protein DinB